MSEPQVIDAGPALNFFSIKQENLLIRTLGPLSMPETVHHEIERKAAEDRRFARSSRVLKGLSGSATLLTVLSDDDAPELDAVVARVTRMPLSERRRTSKDLGELMVIAHAVVAAEAGAEVSVIIDDGRGVELAEAEARRLKRLSGDGNGVGSLEVLGTVGVLRLAVRQGYFTDRGEVRSVYDRLVALDDGLPRDIRDTGLTSRALWPKRADN